MCVCSKYVITLLCLCVFYLGEGDGGITIAMGTQVLKKSNQSVVTMVTSHTTVQDASCICSALCACVCVFDETSEWKNYLTF